MLKDPALAPAFGLAKAPDTIAQATNSRIDPQELADAVARRVGHIYALPASAELRQALLGIGADSRKADELRNIVERAEALGEDPDRLAAYPAEMVRRFREGRIEPERQLAGVLLGAVDVAHFLGIIKISGDSEWRQSFGDALEREGRESLASVDCHPRQS